MSHTVLADALCNKSMSHFVIADTLCNNNLSHFVIKLLCCTLQYEICQKSQQNWVVTLCNKITISISLTSNLPRLYLFFYKTHGHYSWQSGGLRWTTISSKVTWSFDHVANEKCYISTSTMPTATKLDTEVASDEKMLSKKLHNPLIM